MHFPARPEGESLEAQRIANTKPQGSATTALPKTATPAGLQMLIGALALLLALMLTANSRTRRERT